MKTVYMVVFDGYLESYGSETFLAGIFDIKEKADEVAEKVKKKLKELTEDPIVNIFTIPMNTEIPIMDANWFPGYTTEINLGGYIE